jgi:hypothetical protein
MNLVIYFFELYYIVSRIFNYIIDDMADYSPFDFAESIEVSYLILTGDFSI